MNIKILLLLVSAAAISSCSTAYRSGQTPDDVYFSPTRVAEEDSRAEEQKERKVSKNDYYEDRSIRMTVYDRRWRDFDDDYNYRYDPYHYGYSYGYYYNPYYCYYPVYITNVVISNPKNTVPRMTNLGSYNNTNYSVNNTKTSYNSIISNRNSYNNSNNNNTFIRRILTSPSPVRNSNNNSNYNQPENNTRSYTPSSNSGSSGSSSGGSGTPVTRPGRGG